MATYNSRNLTVKKVFQLLKINRMASERDLETIKDEDFVHYTNKFIKDELVYIETCNSNSKQRDRFLVFKQAFSKVY